MKKKRKKKGSKSKLQTTPENGKCIMESLKRRNQSNLGRKPIASSTKQVVRGDETSKRTPSLEEASLASYYYMSQDSGDLNSLSQKHSLPIK